MSEQLTKTSESSGSTRFESTDIGRVTLFEALAENTEAVGVDRSNHTSQAPDFDDQ
jgi:hypothetical protein